MCIFGWQARLCVGCLGTRPFHRERHKGSPVSSAWGGGELCIQGALDLCILMGVQGREGVGGGVTEGQGACGGGAVVGLASKL